MNAVRAPISHPWNRGMTMRETLNSLLHGTRPLASTQLTENL